MESIEFQRGGQRVRLYKSPTLIAVRFRDSSMVDNLAARLPDAVDLPLSTRFVKRFPGKRVAVCHCSAGCRDDVMDRLRKAKGLVQYCSHVFHRTDDEAPGLEVGLDNRLFVEYKRAPSVKRIRQLERKRNLRAIWQFPEDRRGVVFELTQQANRNPIKISEELLNEERYVTVEPCLIEPKVARAVPNDPAFRYQWHLLNTGQGRGLPGADCNATAAWDFTWGSPDITIALIDDGFDLNHPDLGPSTRIRFPYDATQRDSDPRPWWAIDNHGTSCAGVALASRSGGLTIGAAPDCSFMPIRHAGRLGDLEEALAFYHAYRNGADVISCSWGPPDAQTQDFVPLPSLTRYVVDLCARFGRAGRGIPIFFAAGNGNEPLGLDGYASYENVIAVAATTNLDTKARYSDYGDDIWVAAPSNGGTLGIVTTDRLGSDGYNDLSDYTTTFGGTSSATPLAAGIAALMLSVNTDLTPADIKRILKKTAVKVNRDQPRDYVDTWGNTYSDEYDSDGHSKVFGWGRIDAGEAVRNSRAQTSYPMNFQLPVLPISPPQCEPTVANAGDAESLPSNPRHPDVHLFSTNDRKFSLIVEGSQIFEIPADFADDMESAIAGGFDDSRSRISRLFGEYGLEPDCRVELAPPVSPPIRSLSLSVAQKCNLGCEYCYAQQGDFGGSPRNMSVATALQALDLLFQSAAPGDRLQLTFLGGEPLMNRPVIHAATRAAAARAERIGAQIGFSITTNATLVESADADFFEEFGFSVTVSIDGPRETHNRLRPFKSGRGSYDETMRRVDPLLRQQQQMQVSARVTVTPENLALTETLDELIERRFHSAGFSPMLASPTGRGEMDAEGLSTMLEQMIECGRRFEWELAAGHRYPFLNMLNAMRELHCGSQRPYPCGAALGYFGVSADGNLFACHRFVDDPAGGMGDLNHGVDENRRAAWLADRHVHVQEPCSSCWARYLCGGGCHHEVIHRGRPACDYIRGWLHYCLQAYVRLLERRPDWFGMTKSGTAHT